MSDSAKSVYEFGPFRVDAAERQLWRDGEEISLTPKAFGVLLTLVEHAGQTLSKDELMRAVWPDAVVEEGNLADNVSTLRQALGDDKSAPRYIKTVPRRGYRFVAGVTEARDEEVDLIVAEHTRARIVVEEQSGPAGETHLAAAADQRPLIAAPEVTRQPRRNLRPVGLALALAVAAALGAYAVWKNRAAVSAPLARSIAVLPFKPLVAGSADPALELGITDALITKLSNIREVVVRPTNSVLKYAAEGQDLRVAGSELGVDVLLDGRVQKAGDRIRLSVQLLRAADGVPIWAENFDEEFKDIFAMQDAISERVAAALALRLTGEEKKGLAKRYTDNVEAYRLYLQGRQHWGTFTREGREKSINYYNEALKLDPDYALAYTGLANTYIVAGIYGPPTPAEVMPKAREAIRRALELDEGLYEAHISAAAFKIMYERDWPGAERELKRAMELNPNDAGQPDLYGYYLTAMGRPEEALASHRRAKELAPLWQITANDLLDAYFFARRYDEAIEQSREMLRLERDNGFAAWVLAKALNMKGLYDEAAAEITPRLDSPELSENSKGRLLTELGYSYAAAGKRDAAAKVVEQLKAKPDPRRPVQLAKIYAGAGDREQAFKWLTKAADDLFPFLYEVKAEAHFDGLRSDPRYAELLRRMNLDP